MTIVTCSSVGTDVYLFLNTIFRTAGFEVNPLFMVSDTDYRQGLRHRGLVRLLLRTRMYVYYPFKVFLQALKAHPSTIFVVTSNTFFTPLIVAIVGSLKKFKTIHL